MKPIKQKIEELVPPQKCLCYACQKHSCCSDIIPITLAVVLRAIQKRPSDNEHYLVNSVGRFFRDTDEGCMQAGEYGQDYISWNLTKDNFDDQSPETQLFIGRLLGV